MAYVPPTVDTFRARYPEFSGVSGDLLALVLAEAIEEVGDTWIERDRAKAQMLLAAHKLAMEGEPARSTTGKTNATTGAIKRRKVGDVETEYAGVTSGAGGSSSHPFAGSTYGQAYWELLRRNFPGPLVF